jgi:hypothetical protein
MIDRYGGGATRRAELRAIELRAVGEPGASETWERVKTAIERLRAMNP